MDRIKGFLCMWESTVSGRGNQGGRTFRYSIHMQPKLRKSALVLTQSGHTCTRSAFQHFFKPVLFVLVHAMVIGSPIRAEPATPFSVLFSLLFFSFASFPQLFLSRFPNIFYKLPEHFGWVSSRGWLTVLARSWLLLCFGSPVISRPCYVCTN